MNAHVISLTRLSVLRGRKEIIPNPIIWAVVGISILPFLMSVAGADFGSTAVSFAKAGFPALEISNPTKAAFHRLSGAFTHTILEWSAFCVAIFTVCLAFSHYRINHDPTAPIIAVALVCAGSMDAFHTLAADRLIDAVADNKKLIPFTWAVCRVFNVLILIVGIGLLLFKKKQKLPTSLSFIISVSALFGGVAYAIIHFAATSSELPQTMFPDQFITRPWDFGPLLLYLFCGLYLFPLYHKKYPSLFAQGLIISTIPDVAVETHMAFGSTALFDSHFNIAHFLKIIAYGVPLTGLMLDYSQSYQLGSRELTARKAGQNYPLHRSMFDEKF